jgi:hypothetical protein
VNAASVHLFGAALDASDFARVTDDSSLILVTEELPTTPPESRLSDAA